MVLRSCEYFKRIWNSDVLALTFCSKSIFWKTLSRTPPTSQHPVVGCCHGLQSNPSSTVKWCSPPKADYFDKNPWQCNTEDDNLRHGWASDDNFSSNVLHISSWNWWVELWAPYNNSRDWCGWWTSGIPWISPHWTSHTCCFARPGVSQIRVRPCQSTLFYRLPEPAWGSEWRRLPVLHSLLPFRPLQRPRFQYCRKVCQPAWGIKTQM